MTHQVIQINYSTQELVFSIYCFYIYCFRCDRATYLSLLFKFILSERLSICLWELHVLLFLKLINIVSISALYLFEFIRLLHPLLVNFLLDKKYIVWQIWCNYCFHLCKCYWQSLKHIEGVNIWHRVAKYCRIQSNQTWTLHAKSKGLQS